MARAPAVATISAPRRGGARSAEREPFPLWDGYPATCPIHALPLRDDVVPIVYGLQVTLPVREFRDAQCQPEGKKRRTGQRE